MFVQNLRKSVAKLSIIGIIFTPWGADGSCARDWRGLATALVPGPERTGAELRKARFFVEQKMRPNEVVKKFLIIC
jgi:hypothetical protein